MPSSYTTSLRLTLPATGELSGQWGTTVNTGITELVDSAVAGTTTISTWGGAGVPYTLSNNSGTADEARRMFIVATGTPGEAKNVICPAVSKMYVFRNDTTGGFALTLKTSGGTGIAVPAGQYKFLYCDGTNVVEAVNSLGPVASLTASQAVFTDASKNLVSNAITGTGNVVMSTSPTLVTPVLGAATATSINGLTVSSTTGTLSLANGSTLATSGANSLTMTTTGATNVTFPTSGTLATTAGTVASFSAGSTGFTPSTATTGAVTLAGTLATANGGTGLTSFTANGVVYASSTSALATGSALTFDGTDVGIGGAPVTGLPLRLLRTSSGAQIRYQNTAATWDSGVTAAGAYEIFSAANTSIQFGLNAAEQMRLTSTGLGIGTSSPGAKLEVLAANAMVKVNASGSFAQLGYYNSGTLLWNAYADIATSQYRLGNSGGTQLTLDSSGNLGLGLTPTVSSLASFQSTYGIFIGNNEAHTTKNAYYNAGWKYVAAASTTAARFSVGESTSAFTWNQAVAGTAGNAISFTQALTLDANRNLLLNGTAAPASGVGTLAIFNGTAPTGSVTDGIVLYAEDVSSSSELKVRDEAGNVTTLSPHNFELIPEGPSEDMAWSYYSERDGKRINVDMLKAIRLLEKLSGEQLVYEA